MKLIIIIITVVLSQQVAACGSNSDFIFGGFSTDGQHNHQFGESASIEDGVVTIDTSFIERLVANPEGKELKKNREELFYLIASGNDSALNAGIKVFVYLLNNPEFYYECDTKYEAWNKEELAFVISRNYKIHSALCRLTNKKWDTVSAYYKQHPDLWGIRYDPPWLASKAEMCEQYSRHFQSK